MGLPRRHTPIVAAAASLVLAAGLLSACAPPHGTASVQPVGTTTSEVVFTAAPGKANVVTVSAVAGTSDLLVHDEGDTITPGSQCTAVDPNTVRCGPSPFVSLRLGDRDDTAWSDNVSSQLNGIRGGPGNDVLNGGSLTDLLSGDEGSDTLNGNGGSDTLVDGMTQASTDVLDADIFNGGPGRDQVMYRPTAQAVNVSLNGLADDGRPGEGDDVRFDVESLFGGAGPDVLRGDADDNLLFGDQGDDELVGNRGNDTLDGNFGRDRLVEGAGAANTDSLDADTFVGGLGSDVDTVSYESATASVRVDLDDVADDGRQATPVSPAEGDNVRSDVEDVTGGGGNDSLFGDADANLLAGNPGADFINGDAGNDTLLGQAGFDPLDGGPGTADDCDVGGTGPDGGSELNCEI
jgi:Ca2+-binding RTX toxin-like protein